MRTRDRLCPAVDGDVELPSPRVVGALLRGKYLPVAFKLEAAYHRGTSNAKAQHIHIGMTMNADDTAARTPVIACVDDDVSVREALGGLLGAFGFVVKTFESAEAFLASESFDRVTCLITDVQLGGISGLQLLRHLVEMRHLLPTIVITALPDEELRRSVMDAGAFEFLTKPITVEQILSALRKIADRSAT